MSQPLRPVSDSMANSTTGTGTVANNNPVGSAGQPQSPKLGAIQRRMAAITKRNNDRKQGNL
jgi:hypothetical protein